jgi:hypothetical protein
MKDFKVVSNWSASFLLITLYFIYENSELTSSIDIVLLEKPVFAQLLENFPKFYGTQRFITVFSRTHY